MTSRPLHIGRLLVGQEISYYGLVVFAIILPLPGWDMPWKISENFEQKYALLFSQLDNIRNVVSFEKPKSGRFCLVKDNYRAAVIFAVTYRYPSTTADNLDAIWSETVSRYKRRRYTWCLGQVSSLKAHVGVLSRDPWTSLRRYWSTPHSSFDVDAARCYSTTSELHSIRKSLSTELLSSSSFDAYLFAY